MLQTQSIGITNDRKIDIHIQWRIHPRGFLVSLRGRKLTAQEYDSQQFELYSVVEPNLITGIYSIINRWLV